VLPKAIAVAVLSSIAIAAAGCSGDSDAEAESPPATTTEQVIQSPRLAAVDISELPTAFKERFGTPGNETPLYRFVTGLKIAHGRVEVETTLDPGGSFEGMCGAIWGLASEFLKKDRELVVAVIASDGGVVGCA
jgi:hypothetical protein